MVVSKVVMWDKIQQGKKLMQLRSQAMEMQKQLRAQTLTVEENGFKIVVNGAQEIQELEIDGEEQKKLREAINKSLKKSQEIAAKKLQEMGGGLSGLLGGM